MYVGTKISLPWKYVMDCIRRWNDDIRSLMPYQKIDAILAVSRGGIIPGFFLAQLTHVPDIDGSELEFKVVEPFVEDSLKEFSEKNIILVDDIYDTGATSNFFLQQIVKWNITLVREFFVVDRRAIRDEEEKKAWFVFPWEGEQDTVGGREQSVVSILRSVGEDPLREGLKDTPRRVSKMYDELCCGYDQHPKDILSATFSTEEYDEMVVLKSIVFSSLCEHHLLPFRGVVHFAYIPDKRVVGVSKIARLVECFSRRLQIQERMTMEIGKSFEKYIKPKGVGVVVEASHECMCIRGVKKESAEMVTSYLGGVFREKLEAREEFLRLAGK